ncbi:MAG: PadR family transcriptional regulator [Alphaproteobacteria bacterium]|nr:PadR family transcriptional regulator [Alphaproteobacteria bacterium]MDE1985171.1 PadR family transcriptional regulator [Alphaproteobacteria bacterium]MDE2161816.1 PadR family transcriptional regulator [Alphaproteobacteria bacterium]MDE2264277.1 PadR family transcriptional regulator [Alphaproteobacteria bacterium]MDE2499674.1 PadR family transcriptional regulator [Alphaproteobacteria bacterium]
MDVRTICLGILTRADATGYEIKKRVEEGGYRHFVEASFGSIYPALDKLTKDGLVSVRAEVQEKKPNRKVYSITKAGRSAFIAALMGPLPQDCHRWPFAFAMKFADLLPEQRIAQMLDAYTAQTENTLTQLQQAGAKPQSRGEHFATGLGRAAYGAILDYLREHRVELEVQTAEAAE